MTLRIVERSGESGEVIALHGRLGAAEVEELERTAAQTGGSLRLDLTQLTGVDAEGLQALQRLQQGGARLIGVSQYIALLLERTAEGGGDGRRFGSSSREP